MAGALLFGASLTGAVGLTLARYASARARRALMRLLARAPRVAHRVQDGRLATVAVDEVESGDVLLGKEADVVPVDSVVLEGTAIIDASALTGEAQPIERGTGDPVAGGTVHVGAAFRMCAVARASESTYTGIVRLIEAAQQSKTPAVRLADRAAAALPNGCKQGHRWLLLGAGRERRDGPCPQAAAASAGVRGRRMRLVAFVPCILAHMWGTLLGKVRLQPRQRESDRQDRDFPFPQGCDGLLERPGIDPPVVQQGDQGALVGARIG